MSRLKPKPANLKKKEDIEKEISQFRAKDKKYDIMSKHIGKPDTRSIWFRFDQIQELWEEMIYQTVSNKKDVSGVRLYFTTDLSSSYKDQMGVVFVLTENVGSNEYPKHTDFFIEKQGDFKSRPDHLVKKGSELEILNLDHGTPCPPDCSGDQDPAWP